MSVQKFQEFIFSWWKEHKRDLPWRHTHDPYRIFISELMLQQTQVSRVILRYNEFLTLFPRISDLALSPLNEILVAWKGLGYNKRALFAQKTAVEIVKNHHGVFPKDPIHLMMLPGIGVYTSQAICVFAYRMDLPLVDTNIRKIITHFFYDGVVQKEKEIEATARKILPIGKSWEWHQALMDFGALELPKLLPKKKTVKGRIRFKDTDRFIRGKIIDVLRDGTYTEKELLPILSDLTKRDEEAISKNLQSLIGEGLIVFKRETYHLGE